MSLSTFSTANNTAVLFDFDHWQTGGGKGNPLPFEQSNFASYWDKIPTIFEGKEDDTKTASLNVNGHSVLGRHAVYKYLIENTGFYGIHDSLIDHNDDVDTVNKKKQDVMGILWGNELERHFLWGYGSILDWEARSGRLLYPTMIRTKINNNSINEIPPDNISTDSWWGYVNFNFCICILLGAIEAGVVQHTKLVLDEASTKLVNTDTIVKESIHWWAEFWKGPFTEYSRRMVDMANEKEVKHLPLNIMDPLYDDMNTNEWSVHSKVFQFAVFEDHPGCKSKDLLSQMPQAEQNFSVGFCRIVDMMAALNVRTDLVTTSENGVGYLPIHVLSNDDNDDDQATVALTEIEKKRKRTVQNMHALSKMDNDGVCRMVKFWKRLAKWKMIRGNISQILHDLTHGSRFKKGKELIKISFFLLLPATPVELAGWTALGAVGMWYDKRANR